MSQQAFYQKRYEAYQKQALDLTGKSNTISTLRLAEFVVGAVAAYIGFRSLSPLAGWMAVLVALAGFVVLVNWHGRVKSQLERAQCKAEINGEYLARIKGDWKQFSDKGQEYADPDHPYTQDLDIFGDKSLFQYLNLTRTYLGRERLSHILKTPEEDPKTIRNNQDKIRELAGKVDFSQEVQCEGRLNSKIGSSPEALLTASEDKQRFIKTKTLENAFYLLPALTLLSLVFSLLYDFVPGFVPVVLIIVQLIIMAVGFSKTNAVLRDVAKFKNHILVYGRMLSLIEEEAFADSFLKVLQARLGKGGKQASKQLKKLVGISEAADIRFSPLIHFFLNLFLLWDYHCIFAFEEWKRQNGRHIRLWLETIGEVEALLSLAVIAQVHPDWCYAEMIQHKPFLHGVELGHPLLSDDSRVCNDVEIKNQLCVITGSNMSGKTTLLRTIGINLVLAYAGAPVCARSMSCSMMKILTSMRINDDLGSGISTFYAELLRIKMIIDFAKSHEKNMIFLIDELFRGTNSKDRLTGAIHVLKALNLDWVSGLISTHDIELCELENEDHGRIRNYHFSESYSENKIHFDYKLRPGRSTTTNARYLMRMVGIDIP